jgi:xanthine/uracil permease
MKRILISVMVGMVIGLVLGTVLGHKVLPPTPEQVVDHISHMSFPELAAFNRKLTAQSGLQVYQTQILPPTAPVIPAVPGK